MGSDDEIKDDDHVNHHDQPEQQGGSREYGPMITTKAEAMARVREILDVYRYIMSVQKWSGIDVEFMTKVELVSATPPPNVEIVWELDVTQFYANLQNVMHGGAAAVIFDMATNVALCPVQKEGYWDFMGGVTRTLNVSYLKAVPIGVRIRIRSQLVQHGRTMALIRGVMESMDGKTIYATCEHHKVNVPSMAEHLKLREEMRNMKRQKSKL